MNRHEALDDWLERSQVVLDEYEAQRASVSPSAGAVSTKTAVEVENVPETPPRAPEAHTSPNFYV